MKLQSNSIKAWKIDKSEEIETRAKWVNQLFERNEVFWDESTDTGLKKGFLLINNLDVELEHKSLKQGDYLANTGVTFTAFTADEVDEYFTILDEEEEKDFREELASLIVLAGKCAGKDEKPFIKAFNKFVHRYKPKQ